MIKKVKYKDINFSKYENCIENSVQRKYSATKIYLDITTSKNWEILVYKDYEAVMPVPYISKYGFKMVVNPKLCQQLGIFSRTDDVAVNDLFLKYFENKFRIWHYAFNDTNTFTKKLKERKNFLIFPENYEVVRQKYSPKRKRKLRLDAEILQKSEVKEINFQEVSGFVAHNFLGAKNEKDRDVFFKIFEDFEKKQALKIFAFFLDGKIINTIIVYIEDKTVALLGTFNDRDFVKISGASVLIDMVISKYIGDKIFDFEGSEIPAIEEFFRGFRPELKVYPSISYSKIEILKNFFKK